ncbi:MAG: LAGLIDADG family homing endonuclease [Promethearchaeota archaeon]
MITSDIQIHSIIDNDFPGLKRNPNFRKLLSDAKLHLALYQEFSDRKTIFAGELTRVTRDVCKKREREGNFQTLRLLISDYVKKCTKPRLYYLFEQAVSKTESQGKIDAINKTNNYVCSFSDVFNKLATYFPTSELVNSTHFSKRINQVSKYFSALELLKEGGLFADVAREYDTRYTVISRWFNNQMRPVLVHLAANIPHLKPRNKRLWLPTKMGSGHTYKPKGFIQVPFSISKWLEIRDVLDQLKELEHSRMRGWHNRFGDTSQEQAFGYILGVLVSDASKPKNKQTSSHIKLQLSMKYTWSEVVGEASCYFLGKLGIRAKRGKDYRNSRGTTFYCWNSECSPLITWIKRSCLGIQHKETTTHHPIRMEWLFRAPKIVRIRFLQGLNDGDGWASVKSQEIGNASGPSTNFVQTLLRTLDIESRQSHSKDEVRIGRKSSLKVAAELPFFLFATTRQEAADKIADMMKRRETQQKPVTSNVVTFMKELRKRRMSYGRIAEAVFDEFNLSHPISKIYKILNQEVPNAKD